jgi:hypothetical protein
LIYICIPAHNEEQTVGVVLWKIRQVMAEFPRDYQLLVVDDASSDKTPDVLAPYARVLPLTVVRPDRRRGPADAVEMMLREAVRRSEYPKRDIVVTLQADFTQEPDELVGLIKRMEAGADIVVGQPLPSPEAPLALRWGRRLARRLLGRRLMPEGVADPFMGYTAYRVFTLRRALEEANGRLVHWGGWAGAAELLAAAAPHARRIEALDMIERRERLQRPSRLQVWPSLKSVWALVRGALPEGLAEPAELDEAMRSVAARRTSELALAPRERTPRQERGEGSQRTTRRRGSTEERGRERRPRGERPERSERRPRAERPARPAGERNGRRRNGRPAVAGAAPSEAPAEEALPPVLEGAAGESGAPEAGAEPARRKRSRRRRRPASAESPAPQGGDGEDGVPAAPGEEAEAGTEAADSEGATRARRRRRGRRGGRRRSGGAAAQGTESSTESEAALPAVETRAPEAYDEPIPHD